MLEDLAGLAAAQEQHGRALTLAGAAAALRHALGAPQSPADQEQVERWVGPAREALGAVASTAWAAGQVMTLEQAIAYAMANGADDG